MASAPKSGNRRVVNEAGTLRCGGFTQNLPRTTDEGRIQVKQGGRRPVATGIADGSKSRIVFEHDDSDPGVWTGSVKVRRQGVSVTLDYVMTYENEKRPDGSMIAEFKAAGRNCVLHLGSKLAPTGN